MREYYGCKAASITVVKTYKWHVINKHIFKFNIISSDVTKELTCTTTILPTIRGGKQCHNIMLLFIE